MFERYTEKARRSIFFARWEASQFGSPYIEPEHLLLGLIRHVPYLNKENNKEIRAEIERDLPRGEKTSTSVDLPLSSPAKRSLEFAAEESERANHPNIDVQHLLLGLTRESNSVASLLQKHGIDRERILREGPETPAGGTSERAGLHALVESLPAHLVQQATRMLENLQHRPPGPPSRIAELRKEMQERFRRGLKPGMAGGGGSGGSWRTDEAGRIRSGSYSSNRFEDGAQVFETHHFHEGHEITVTERFRMSEDGSVLSYSQEITGPGQSLQHAVDFDVSKDS